jgi:hypothetical protein
MNSSHETFNERMVISIKSYKKATGLTITEIQNSFEGKAKELVRNLEGELKLSPTFLSDLINGKINTPAKLAYPLSRYFQLPEDTDDLFCLWIMKTYPEPINQYMVDGYLEGMKKQHKCRWNAVINKMDQKSKHYYGFKMRSGEVFEIKHGDLTSTTPFFIETDKLKKTQSACSDEEFIKAILNGTRTRTICIKKNEKGNKVKQYNMYKLTSKNVEGLVRICFNSKQVLNDWKLPTD